MGPEIALAMALGGTGLGIAGQQQAKREQKSILNRALQRSTESQDKTAQKVLTEAGSLDPTQRAQAMQTAEDQTYAQSTGDLKSGAALDASGNAIINTAGDAGNVSGEFLARKADKALAEGDRMTAIARELAKTRAPGQVVNNENQRRASMTGDLNSMWSTTKNLNDANQMDAANVEEPWWGQLGKIAAAVGSAAGGGLGALGGAGAAASGANYGLSGLKLGEQAAAPGFWGNAARLTF